MANRKHGFRYAVALSEIGKFELSTFSSMFIRDGILNCEMVDINGLFVEMTVRYDLPEMFGKEYDEVVLLIPHSYIAYIFSYPPERKLGFFQNAQSSADTTKDQHPAQ
jgi:hypothetical protein